MTRGWLCLLLFAACGSSEDKPKPKPVVLPEAPPPADAPSIAIDPDLPPVGPAKPPPDPYMPPAPQIQPAPPPTFANHCLQESEAMFVGLDGDELRACSDSDQDGVYEKCARWSRVSGRFRDFVDHDDDKEPLPAISFEEDTEDDRLELIDPQIEVCPPDRFCVKLMPKLPDDDGEITGLAADPAYRTLAVAMRDSMSEHGYIELWDLVAGRVRTKAKLRKLEADTEYDFNARFVGNALVAVAIRSDNDMGQGVIYGADGSFRGELGNGSRFLDMQSIFELTPGTLAMLDLEAPGIPYAVYIQSTAGRVNKKFVVPMDMDGDDDDAHMHKVSPTMLAVTQWSTELRLDLIDLATGRQTTYRVPSC